MNRFHSGPCRMGWPRNRQAEIMDGPGLDAGLHRQALRALERINLLSGSASSLWRGISRLAVASPRPLRVLDVASGAGDVPIRLWQVARRRGLDIDVAGCDVSTLAVSQAQGRAARGGAGVAVWRC